MAYVIIIYHGSHPLPGSPAFEALDEKARTKLYADYAELNRDPRITLRLPPMAPKKATTILLQDGQIVRSEGPHLSEGIGGAFVVDVDDLEDAIAIAARVPQASTGGAVEIRPVERYF